MRPLRCSGSSRVVNRILYDLNSKWKGHLFCIFEGKCFETRGGNNTTSSIQQDLNCTLHCLWWQWWLQFSWGGGNNCLWEGFSNGGNNRHRQQQLDSFHTLPNLIKLDPDAQDCCWTIQNIWWATYSQWLYPKVLGVFVWCCLQIKQNIPTATQTVGDLVLQWRCWSMLGFLGTWCVLYVSVGDYIFRYYLRRTDDNLS